MDFEPPTNIIKNYGNSTINKSDSCDNPDSEYIQIISNLSDSKKSSDIDSALNNNFNYTCWKIDFARYIIIVVVDGIEIYLDYNKSYPYVKNFINQVVIKESNFESFNSLFDKRNINYSGFIEHIDFYKLIDDLFIENKLYVVIHKSKLSFIV